MKRRNLLWIILLTNVVIFCVATIASLRPVHKNFSGIIADSQNVPVTDRNGQPLSVTYQTQWNSFDVLPLYQMPELLKTSFQYSEDRRFFDHNGVDWQGRGSALLQNIKQRRTVRGASTITEQVVRMINPRPRNLWSKWLEGIEATLLERQAGKADILEFYLNQLPYASHRRGVVQAARYYFNRDLDTLSAKEIMALTILARAPSAYDLYRHPDRLLKPLERLAQQMKEAGKLTPTDYADIQSGALELTKPSLPVDARHFVRHARMNNVSGILTTTLDAGLQTRIQSILDNRLEKLRAKNVHNAGAIVIDHTNGEILSWVVGGADDKDTKAGDIDTVLAPRQPGSTLKPFLYAQALEKGWTAARILNDAPISEAVGSGLHRFRNYSNTHYGQLTLREALGNSLNIPAILTIHYVGVDDFLSRLHRLGFHSLNRGSQIYDEGLALGNGEVTLYELARAYAALANRGQYRDFKTSLHAPAPLQSEAIYSPEIVSIVGDILSDPAARSLEFGRDSVLNFPVRTAAKTGTSTDYRDAWAVGYNDRYVVALWMGNLDRTPMKDVTGSTGPALVMRSIFNILNQHREPQRLYLSPALVQKEVCTRPGKTPCPMRSEWFVAGTQDAPSPQSKKSARKIEIVRPTDGLMLAYDPRIPADHQHFRFELSGLGDGDEVTWTLNGKVLTTGYDPQFLWPVQKGTHELSITILRGDNSQQSIPTVKFTVR
jgi:penicillin-binding protein 1C